MDTCSIADVSGRAVTVNTSMCTSYFRLVIREDTVAFAYAARFAVVKKPETGSGRKMGNRMWAKPVGPARMT